MLIILSIFAPFFWLPPTQAKELSTEEREALAQVDVLQNSAWAQCTDSQGAKHLITRVVPRPFKQNSFAPVLGTGEEHQVGYYDLLLYKKEDGKYQMGLEYSPAKLTVADEQNGIQGRYIVKLFVPAYRVYDPRTGWSPWSSGTAGEKEKINFANFTVTKQNNVWNAIPQYNIMTNGQFTLPQCSEVPK